VSSLSRYSRVHPDTSLLTQCQLFGLWRTMVMSEERARSRSNFCERLVSFNLFHLCKDKRVVRYCQKATKKSKQLIRMQRVQVFSDWCQLVSHHSKIGRGRSILTIKSADAETELHGARIRAMVWCTEGEFCKLCRGELEAEVSGTDIPGRAMLGPTKTPAVPLACAYSSTHYHATARCMLVSTIRSLVCQYSHGAEGFFIHHSFVSSSWQMDVAEILEVYQLVGACGCLHLCADPCIQDALV
jgi:hypothetical protein